MSSICPPTSATATPRHTKRSTRTPHGAPSILPRTSKRRSRARRRRSHATRDIPGASRPRCFSPLVPLLKLGIVEPEIFVVGITGSTGSGREPTRDDAPPRTAQQPLRLSASRSPPRPRDDGARGESLGTSAEDPLRAHSGPFARGIHTTIQGRLRAPLDAEDIRSELARFYSGSPLVRVVPGLAASEGRGREQLRPSRSRADGERSRSFSVIDNLLKGAAGAVSSGSIGCWDFPNRWDSPSPPRDGSDDCDRSRSSAAGLSAASSRRRLGSRGLSPHRRRAARSSTSTAATPSPLSATRTRACSRPSPDRRSR